MVSKVLLNERYRLVERIGEGGMAVVYRAHDQRLGREVAVKMLWPQYASNPSFVQRFRREAHAAAVLNHAHVASVYDTGEDQGCHYIVMELLPSRTLKDEIEQQGPLPIERALNIALQVGQALQHAHSKQLVHRDIKPHNILFTAEGQVKVTDFGIAQALTSDSLTETGTILGSVHYLSPEQAQGQLATPQSDLYSLGVVLYEMLTGQPPYQGETPVAVALQHVQGRYVSMRTLNPRIPFTVDQVVQRAMARAPEQRFASAREMVLALQQARTSPDQDRTQVLPSSLERTQVMSPSSPPPTYLRAGYETDAAPRKPREPGTPRNVAGSIAAVVVIVALCLGAFLWGSGQLQQFFSPIPQRNPPARAPLTFQPEPRKVVVPHLLGLLEEEAQEGYGAAGWQLVLRGREDKEDPPGTIVWQEPAAGERVDESQRTISYRISSGKVKVPVPDVTNQLGSQAQEMLEESGLTVESVTQEENPSVPEGHVIRQRPKPLARVEKGTAVHLVISSGPPPPPPPQPDRPSLDVAFGHAGDPETDRQVITVVLSAAADAPEQHVQITSSYGPEMEVEEFNGLLSPGQRRTKMITSVGPTTIRVYVDGELFEEDSF